MIDQTLTTPPDAPSSNDIPTFRTRFDTFIAWIVTFVSQLTTVISQMNSTASTINDKEASTIASAQVAVSAANFKGTYTTQTTQVGESYLWNGIIYLVLVAGNTSPTASPSNWKAIGISDQIHSSSSKTTPIDADEFGIWDSISLSLKRLTWANLKATIINSFGVMVNTLTSKIRLADGDIIPIGDSSSGFASKYITYDNLKRSIPNGIRQTVQSASVDANGQPNFITIGTGLSVNILATTTPIKVNFAYGDTDDTATITADTTITGLSASATNYLYADIALDGTVTLGSTTLAPEYQQGLPSTDFPTLDTVNKGSGVTLSNGNLTATKTVVNSWANSNVYASKLVKYGKFYAEVTVGSVASTDFLHIGVSTINTEQSSVFSYIASGYSYLNNGNKVNNASSVSYGASYTTGDKIGVLYDYTTGQLTFYKNGVSQGVAYTLTAGTPVYLAVSQYSTGNITVNYGATAFTYSLPSGAIAWNAERIVGKHIFDISTMEMWLSNGTAYDKKFRVFLGEVIANQGTNLKALGTNIGTLTSGGGLASAFDGNTSQTYSASAYIASTGQLSGTIGKDWGVGVTKKVGSLKLYSPSDSGFTSNSANTFTFKFQASQDNSTWVDLYTSGTILDSNSLVISIDSGIDTSTAYRYHRVQLNDSVADGTSHIIAISELELYEYGTEAVTSVVNYALNGKYSSEYRGFINTGTLTKLNHNIGCPCEPPMIMQKCIQNDVVAVAGDELYLLSANTNSYAHSNAWLNGNTFNFREPEKLTFPTVDGTTFSAQTKTKWNWKVLVKRSF